MAWRPVRLWPDALEVCDCFCLFSSFALLLVCFCFDWVELLFTGGVGGWLALYLQLGGGWAAGFWLLMQSCRHWSFDLWGERCG